MQNSVLQYAISFSSFASVREYSWYSSYNEIFINNIIYQIIIHIPLKTVYTKLTIESIPPVPILKMNKQNIR